MNTILPSSPLISSRKVKGTAVYDDSGDKIGVIEKLEIDKHSGLIRYAVMAFGGFWGLRRRCYPLPWRLLQYVETLNGYLIPLTKSHLEHAPGYEQAQWPEFTEEYGRAIDEHYGAA